MTSCFSRLLGSFMGRLYSTVALDGLGGNEEFDGLGYDLHRRPPTYEGHDVLPRSSPCVTNRIYSRMFQGERRVRPIAGPREAEMRGPPTQQRLRLNVRHATAPAIPW